MEAIDVLKTLMYKSSVYPTQAAEEAYSRIDEFKPHLLEAVEFAAKSPKAVLKSESQLHLYSLFILARARVQEAYIPALKILLIGSRTLATLVLDFIKKTYYHRILASLFDGNLEPITGILSEPGHCEYLYSTALDTFCLLAKKNIIDRNEAIDFLNSLIADRGEECARHEVPEAVQFLSREEATANKQHPSRHHHKRDYWELINDFNAIVHINDWADPDDGYPMLRFREDDSVTPEEWRRSDYETPSLHFRGSKPSKSAKTARNDPCPCGSGKKYKKCCGG